MTCAAVSCSDLYGTICIRIPSETYFLTIISVDSNFCVI